MKIIKRNRADLLLLAAIVMAYVGFRLVTQAGQDMGMPQNDGYATSGGIILLIAGALFGHWLQRGRK